MGASVAIAVAAARSFLPDFVLVVVVVVDVGRDDRGVFPF